MKYPLSEQVIADIKQLIAIPSTASNPVARQQAFDFIVNYIRQNSNLTIEEFLSNDIPSLLAYRGPKRPKKFQVLVNGHIDVVPASEVQFQPHIQDGRLYGRGTIDMKAAAYISTKVVCDLGNKLSPNIGLQIVTDEESAGYNGALHQLQQGVITDFILAGEQTDLQINNAAKGICWVKITSHGKTSHSAYPWDGENAILKNNRIIKKILEIYPIPKKEAWQTTANIAQVSADNPALNQIPKKASMKIDFRYVPGDDNFRSLETAKAFVQQIAPDADIEILLFEPAHNTLDEDKFIQKLQTATTKITGKRPKTIVKHGGADVRFYDNVGASAVTFGPTGKGIHGDNEYVTLDSLADFAATLHEFLLQFSK